MDRDGGEFHDLVSLVRAKARRNGPKVALRFSSGDLTYAQLDRESDRIANGLAAAGIGPGHRVAALLFNTPEFPLLWFGLAKRHAVLVPLNTALKGEILRYELADCAPHALVADQRLWEPYAPLREGLAVPREWLIPEPGGDSSGRPEGVSDFATLVSDTPVDPLPPPLPSDPASIMYTSGTTGPPKGAVIPHEKTLRTPFEIGRRSRLSDDSVLFTALPLFHCNAQEMTALTALTYDVTAAFDDRFHASTYWETAARMGATHVSLLISMINVLFKQPERATDRTHGVRTALTAGATKAVWPEFEQSVRPHDRRAVRDDRVRVHDPHEPPRRDPRGVRRHPARVRRGGRRGRRRPTGSGRHPGGAGRPAPGPVHDVPRLSWKTGEDRGGLAKPLVPHGRLRHPRRGRVLLLRRSEEGRDPAAG